MNQTLTRRTAQQTEPPSSEQTRTGMRNRVPQYIEFIAFPVFGL